MIRLRPETEEEKSKRRSSAFGYGVLAAFLTAAGGWVGAGTIIVTHPEFGDRNNTGRVMTEAGGLFAGASTSIAIIVFFSSMNTPSSGLKQGPDINWRGIRIVVIVGAVAFTLIFLALFNPA